LTKQDAYTLTKPVKRRFKRSRLISPGLFIQADVDLADVSNMASSNDKTRFLLIAVDTLSRKLYVEPLLSKKSIHVVQAFSQLWGDDPRPRLVRTDRGKEFLNRQVQAFFKANDIHHFVADSEFKAFLAERVIRTLRSRLHRMIAHNQNERYVDQLQAITAAYNDAIHGSIGVAPSSVNTSNERAVWWAQYAPRRPSRAKQSKKQKPFLYALDDLVRISFSRRAFTKGHDYTFTGELFKVTSRRRRDDIAVYTLEDLAGEALTGTFYSEELVRAPPGNVWKVEKVLKTRKRGKESLVRWLHYPNKFDSWIETASLEDI
jgi:hypothetical protein